MTNETLALAIEQLVKEYTGTKPGSMREYKVARDIAATLVTRKDVLTSALRRAEKPRLPPRSRGKLPDLIDTFMSGREQASVAEIIQVVGAGRTPKQVYNALGLLVRTGRLKRLKYGLYGKPGKTTNVSV